ncbi:MMPL family transporter [Patulibacter brassicae]|uniref:MMPL family transporter n=1 Tax=Patulibacter brassicae TaxID=1705717 RepID=A0ABU4VFD9_9ACTN|nr:MMPL family transporter [Patulibacter brassicae]MDX8150520.1 MMPL family transporter [Patulibacter brassicae]
MSRTRPVSPSGSAPPAAPAGALARLTRSAARGAQRRPKTVLLLWLLLVVGLTAAGSLVGTRSLEGADAGVGESGRAERVLERAGLDDRAAETILVRASTPAAARHAAERVAARLRTVEEVGTVVSGAGPRADSALRTDGGKAVLVQAMLRGDPEDAADHVEPVIAAVDDVRASIPERDATIVQTGVGSVDKAIGDLFEEDLQQAEIFSVPVTLVVLVVAFGALVAALVPLLLGVTAVAGALGAVGLTSQLVPSSDSTASLLVLIGLAVGVDYSLFYIRREREERRRDPTRPRPDAALDAAAATVGRAVLVSGLTVMVALAGLFITGVPDFASMAVGTITVVAIALVGSLTVLPAILALLGDRIDRGRIPLVWRLRARRARRLGVVGVDRPSAWQRVAERVTRRPGAAFLVAVLVLGGLAVPALSMQTAEQGRQGLPADLPAVQALTEVERAFPGAPEHSQIVVTGQRLGDATGRLQQLGDRAREATGGRGPVEVRVSRAGDAAVIEVPMPDHDADGLRAAVERLRSEVAPTVDRVQPGATALVAGAGAGSIDFVDQVNDKLPLVLAFVLGLAFVLLVGTFRSARLALTVIGLNLLSIGAAYGVLTLVFQHTWAEGVLDFTSTGTVSAWLPLMAFVVLFGLSMDYTILVLERVRESRAAGRSPRQAAAEGVGATAGAVTSAAVVMVAVFAIFGTLRFLEMKQMGVGLATAILLDATIVRALALPAALTLLGERGMPVRRARSRARRRAPRGDGLPVADAAWEDRTVLPAADGHAR